MSNEIHGKHLIEGKWLEGADTFSSQPNNGVAYTFFEGTEETMAQACSVAAAAFHSQSLMKIADRMQLLNTIADELESRTDAITQMGSDETGLPLVRLQGELKRTTGQLRQFAEYIETRTFLNYKHEEALPKREPIPRPDLKSFHLPIGPVGIFGASNFPLAFSTAGGDTAAAFAAGCPVVVKAHPAHPGTSELVADAILCAITNCNLNPGLFSMVQGSSHELGRALVEDPHIKAIGFTGSHKAGRALFDIAGQRAEPIPFYGELGSINPMFILRGALATKRKDIANGWVDSVTMGAGQFCTKPGVGVVIEDKYTASLVAAMRERFATWQPQIMLTDAIASAYHAGVAKIRQSKGVEEVIACEPMERTATGALFTVAAADWLAQEHLSEEVFGPCTILVKCEDEDELMLVANRLTGQLTTTLHTDPYDKDQVRQLLPMLQSSSGRVLFNGFPTGVEVCNAMVHGGPYPASTNFGHTSVGTMSIRRFLRAVCYQNTPNDLVPEF